MSKFRHLSLSLALSLALSLSRSLSLSLSRSLFLLFLLFVGETSLSDLVECRHPLRPLFFIARAAPGINRFRFFSVLCFLNFRMVGATLRPPGVISLQQRVFFRRG